MNMISPIPALSVTSKGQVTLRRSVLEHLGAAPGDRLEVEMLPGGRVQMRTVPGGHIDDFIGSLSYSGAAPVSIEDMGQVAAAGWAGEH